MRMMLRMRGSILGMSAGLASESSWHGSLSTVRNLRLLSACLEPSCKCEHQSLCGKLYETLCNLRCEHVTLLWTLHNSMHSHLPIIMMFTVHHQFPNEWYLSFSFFHAFIVVWIVTVIKSRKCNIQRPPPPPPHPPKSKEKEKRKWEVVRERKLMGKKEKKKKLMKTD